MLAKRTGRLVLASQTGTDKFWHTSQASKLGTQKYLQITCDTTSRLRNTTNGAREKHAAPLVVFFMNQSNVVWGLQARLGTRFCMPDLRASIFGYPFRRYFQMIPAEAGLAISVKLFSTGVVESAVIHVDICRTLGERMSLKRNHGS